ncbi:hypothetical protein F4781DRAFT_429373 [Annulohypoxylon bovei var. microspora]|nr:hypothetical protein F4781DRAFT_429373 [Annulohypoxylon bovei var. microspora]
MQYLFVIALFLGFTVARPLFPEKVMNTRARNIINKPWDLAQFHLEPFNLAEMGIECTKKNVSSSLFGCSIKFKWEDPNANQSCICNENWQWDGITQAQGSLNNYSTDYFVCKDDNTEIFQFKFMEVFDLANFSLSLTHVYKDNRNFPTPTIANMFSQPNITLDLMEKSNTTMIYSPACDCPIKANITGMTI